MIRASTFSGKRVAVFGLGGSGIASARALLEGGAEVAAWDDSDTGRAAAQKAGIPLVDLSQTGWSRIASLVLAPGVPLTHPEPHWVVVKARAAGVEIIGDIEIFARERAALCPEAPFIAITGTNGKSTTTALIAHLLRELGRDVQMGGNIGRAILTLEPPVPDRFHVIEMSSFQIDLTPTLKPTVGVILNVTPDHIDRHGTVENYAAIKERLAEGAEAVALGIDDEFTRAMAARVMPPDRLYPFSAGSSLFLPPLRGRLGGGDSRRAPAGLPPTPAPSPQGGGETRPLLFFAEGHTLLVRAGDGGEAKEIASLDGVRSLRGRHNVQNALAALAALRALQDRMDSRPGAYRSLVWKPEALQAALASFPGLAHRMEEIGRLGKVLFINDSKATNADSTEKALASWERDIFWILGGKSKEGGINSLEAYFPRVGKAYLIGAAMEEFAATLQGKVNFERCGTLDGAVAAATRDAKQNAGGEPVVLLSPACASYDQYKNFEIRGDHFRKLVSALPGIEMRGSGR